MTLSIGRILLKLSKISLTVTKSIAPKTSGGQEGEAVTIIPAVWLAVRDTQQRYGNFWFSKGLQEQLIRQK